MPSADFLRAALPLFENGSVEAVEWSFDIPWQGHAVEEWTYDLLDEFSKSGALLGHGVSFSLLSALWDEHHIRWLELLRQECAQRKYEHISEHFGFMRAADLIDNTVLPLSMSDIALSVGVERLQLIRDAAKVPVGLENLALAFSEMQVDDQPEFVDRLLAPVEGFLLLDLHNIWCQVMNFNRDPVQLMRRYPLHRVRQIHISGGSLIDGVRVDTHDSQIPAEVFSMLQSAIQECPNLRYVILERMAETIVDKADEKQFRADFGTMKQIAQGASVNA